MDELLKKLECATSRDQSIRGPAEQCLKQWENNYFGDYLLGLCVILKNSSVNAEIRQLAGLQVKILIGGGKTEESQAKLGKRYFQLSDETRKSLRDTVIPALGTDIPECRKVAAQVVARIASVEIPKGLWDDLIPLLGSVVERKYETKQERSEMRESALLTLGYVGEELEENAEVMTRCAPTILNSVQIGVADDTPSVRLAACNAMIHCLPYVEESMKMEQHRKIILEMILLCCTTNGNDKISLKIKIAGFQALAKLAVLYYDQLSDSITTCAAITFQAMNSEEHAEVRKFAIEFWSSLFTVELEIEESIRKAAELHMQPQRRNSMYAQKSVEKLVPILVNMLQYKSDDIEEDDWTVDKCAGACLASLSEAVGNDILQTVLVFVEGNLMRPEWQCKNAATVVLGIIMNGPDQDSLQEIATQVWGPFVENLTGNNEVLRDSTAWSIGRIFQYCPLAIKPEVLKKIVAIFCQALPQVHPKCAATIAWAISKLAGLPLPYQQTTPLSGYLVELITALIQASSRPDVIQHNLLPACFEALYVLIKTSGNDQLTVLSEELLPKMVTELQNLTDNADNHLAIHKVRELIGCVTAIVQRVKRLNDNTAQILMNIYGATLNRNFTSSVHEEAMAAIGDIANVIGGRFCSYLQVASMMIQIGLTDGYQHPNLCNVSILVLGDVATACKEKLADHSDEFVGLLLKNLAEPELVFDMKPRVVEAIGDVAAALGSGFEKYVEVVMKYLIEAGRSSPGESPSQSLMTQFNHLRAAVLGCLINILDSMKNRKQLLVKYYGSIPQMIISMNKMFPSKKVLYLSSCLVEDMIHLSPQEGIATLVQYQDFFTAFLNAASQSQDADTKQSAVRIQKAINQYTSK